MASEKAHDLYDFMKQLSTEMALEYKRIQKRTTEDPGTAGDQGEENWAQLLRDWLPRNYEVVTKGRIISQDGNTSPQIDVLVLNSAYPKKLLAKKLYMAAGVIAAFECKTTLKSADIKKTLENCEKIKSLFPSRTGTPYKELHSPIIYGLLAHSHNWKGKASTPVENIQKSLDKMSKMIITHPRNSLDILCVADLASWISGTFAFIGPKEQQDLSGMTKNNVSNGSVSTIYFAHYKSKLQVEHFTPIGVFISYLSKKLAWEDISIRGLAEYYRIVSITGIGIGNQRIWPMSIYSDDIRSRVISRNLLNDVLWDEWSSIFM